MLKRVIVVLLALAAIVLGLAAAQDEHYTVTRSVTINAPATKVYQLIEDFHNWIAWSPWENRDAGMNRYFDGEPFGLGAVYTWEGDDEAGAGRIEIVSATAPGSLGMKMRFVRPDASEHALRFDLAPNGQSTVVTWSMTGESDFQDRLLNIFMPIERTIGNEFEAGLAKLKQVAEK